MATCGNCGEELGGDVRFCSNCGAAVPAVEPERAVEESAAVTEPEAPAAELAPAPGVAAAAEAVSLPERAPATPLTELRLDIALAGLPLELWIVIGLFGAAGIYLVQASIRALSDAFDLWGTYGSDWAWHRFVLVIIILLFVVLALGVGLLAIAWMLHRGDRVGRGLAYVAVASLTAIVVFGNGVSTGETLSMVAGFVAAAILAFSGAVRDVFTGPNARSASQPTSIVVARVAMALWIALLTVAAVVNFLLGDVAGKYIAIGVLELVIAIAVLLLYFRLPIRDRTTRNITTFGAIAALILLLVGQHGSGFVVLLGLTAAIPFCLWIPPDAREFYGDPPISAAAKANT